MIPDQLKEDFFKFELHHIKPLVRGLPDELWHYTNADGLIGILTTGALHFTQISCLNDALEHKYFGDLVVKEITSRLPAAEEPVKTLLSVALELLSDRDYSAVGSFVACLSEVHDDLGQWRGYGGGQCGYAIGFDGQRLFQAFKANREGGIMLPLNYTATAHEFIVKDLADYIERIYRAALTPDADLRAWATELILAVAQSLTILPGLIKHPKFEAEKERRLSTGLQLGENNVLQFRQKQTLLARYLAIKLIGPDGRLPITRVVVGPGPSQNVSKISVGDLLIKCGYDAKVELSEVPYRVP